MRSRNSTTLPVDRIRKFPRAFTIVELLIVITIILVLMSVLIVALNAASETAQRAKTQSVINAVHQGLVRFKEDIGYYPPVLRPPTGTPSVADEFRMLSNPPDPGYIKYNNDIQKWYSITTLADYLIGYGNAQEDGQGAAGNSIISSPGIRHPETDGVWSAMINGDGSRDSRNRGRTEARTAKVYGPYLELRDERLLGRLTVQAGQKTILFPGDSGYDTPEPDGSPRIMVIVDYWGQPLRYYRRAYPPGGLKMAYRSGMASFVPSLSDVFLLRPFKLDSGSEVIARTPDANDDSTTTFSLQSAEFAIFSSGPDLTVDETVRYDNEEFNKDNIVGVGP